MQGRFVSYIYKYHRGNAKGENAGYLKVQRMSSQSDSCRINICVKDKQKSGQIHMNAFLYGRKSEVSYKVDFAQLLMINGCSEACFDISWSNVTGNNKSLEEYCGIVICTEDGTIYAVSWLEDDIKPGEIIAGKTSLHNTNESGINNLDKYINNADKNINNVDRGLISQRNANKDITIKKRKSDQIHKELTIYDRILDEKKVIEIKSDSRVDKCVRIEPGDIGRLNDANWGLGKNVFLSYGYFKYRYLMFGRLIDTDNVKKYVIGVPGIYTNKEKYQAVRCGFNTFLPTEKVGSLTGNFGYWITDLK